MDVFKRLDKLERLILDVLLVSDYALSCTEITKRININILLQLKLENKKLKQEIESFIMSTMTTITNREFYDFIGNIKKDNSLKFKTYYYPAVNEALNELYKMKYIYYRELKHRGRADKIWYMSDKTMQEYLKTKGGL